MIRACSACWLGPCMCVRVHHRQADGKGPYECEPAQPDEHIFPHDPASAIRAEEFIRQLRRDTEQSRIARGCDPKTGEKLK